MYRKIYSHANSIRVMMMMMKRVAQSFLPFASCAAEPLHSSLTLMQSDCGCNFKYTSCLSPLNVAGWEIAST